MRALTLTLAELPSKGGEVARPRVLVPAVPQKVGGGLFFFFGGGVFTGTAARALPMTLADLGDFFGGVGLGARAVIPPLSHNKKGKKNSPQPIVFTRQ